MSEFRSCVKVAVAVLGSPSLTVLNMVSADGSKATFQEGCCREVRPLVARGAYLHSRVT